MSQVFRRTKENFICEHCGAQVAGNGYTNHCPKCLWSKHADTNPGDRAAQCGGMMEPIRVETKGREYRIVHRCTTCGVERIVDVADGDAIEILIAGKQ